MFSSDGTQLATPDPVDAVTQLKLMIAALPASPGASDDVRSYDLVWMLHVVGDLHQPLHAVQRHTAQIPEGDRGRNSERVFPATGESFPCIRIGTESLVGIPRSLARSLMRRTVAV